MFLGSFWPECLAGYYLAHGNIWSPTNIIIFCIQNGTNNVQVSYVSGQTCTFNTSVLKKDILPDVHFQSQFNAPPWISNWLKMSGHWPDIQSIPPGCFRHMRDHPCIHATRNIVSLSQWLAYCRPSVESAAPICHVALSTSAFPWFIEH